MLRHWKASERCCYRWRRDKATNSLMNQTILCRPLMCLPRRASRSLICCRGSRPTGKLCACERNTCHAPRVSLVEVHIICSPPQQQLTLCHCSMNADSAFMDDPVLQNLPTGKADAHTPRARLSWRCSRSLHLRSWSTCLLHLILSAFIHLDGTFMDCNPAFVNLLGFSKVRWLCC